MKKLASLSLACLTWGSSSAYAVVIGDFQINGFLSIAAAWSSVDFLTSGVEPVYDTFIRKRPSYDQDSNVGLQFTKPLREDISITTQFLARAANEWHVEAVWAFLKWEPNDCWQFRVGRIRTNPYMLSDYVDVGYAYPWVRPPEEVYSQLPSEFSNLTGVDVTYKRLICKRDLALTAFYGATSSHLNFPVGPNATIFDTIHLRLEDLFSLNLKYGDEVFSIRAGYESTRITLDPNSGTVMQALNTFLNQAAQGITIPTGAPPPFPPFIVVPPLIGTDYVNYFSAFDIRASFMGIGYQFDWKNVVSMAELVKRKAQTPIIANVIGWYVMGGYRIKKQFLPHITFARERLVDNKVRRFPTFINQLFMTPPGTPPFFIGAGSPVPLDTVAQALINTSENFDGGAGSQSSVTLGIRWDIYAGVALKGEFKHVHPDFLSPGLFDVDPHKSVNIYSLALDAVM